MTTGHNLAGQNYFHTNPDALTLAMEAAPLTPAQRIDQSVQAKLEAWLAEHRQPLSAENKARLYGEVKALLDSYVINNLTVRATHAQAPDKTHQHEGLDESLAAAIEQAITRERHPRVAFVSMEQFLALPANEAIGNASISGGLSSPYAPHYEGLVTSPLAESSRSPSTEQLKAIADQLIATASQTVSENIDAMHNGGSSFVDRYSKKGQGELIFSGNRS